MSALYVSSENKYPLTNLSIHFVFYFWLKQ